MKLKYNFESVDMGSEIIAVPVDNGSQHLHGVLKLNKEGFEILEMLKEDTFEEDILDVLTSKYDNDPKDIKQYVHMFVEKLREYSLITD